MTAFTTALDRPLRSDVKRGRLRAAISLEVSVQCPRPEREAMVFHRERPMEPVRIGGRVPIRTACRLSKGPACFG